MSSVNTKAKNEQNFSVGPSERFLKRVIPGVRTKTIKYIKDQSLKSQIVKRQPKIKYKADNSNIIPILKKTDKTKKSQSKDNKKNKTVTGSADTKEKKVLKVLNRTRRITRFQATEPDKIKLKGKIKNIFDLDKDPRKQEIEGEVGYKIKPNSKPGNENGEKERLSHPKHNHNNVGKTVFSGQSQTQKDDIIINAVNSENKKYSIIITALSVSLILLVGFFLSFLTSSTEFFQNGQVYNKLTIDSY